mmetsp:Transcript_84334/g.217182  ORF Transcript_84334/g.217182 Transcript_84334/m.217182 type:complete len:341 (+) Transcript_84334:618-1640(+)
MPTADVGQCHVRTDGRGAIADEAGEMVRAPALASVHDERDLCAIAVLDEVVVHRAHCEHGRDEELIVLDHPTVFRHVVRKDDELSTVLHSVRGPVAEVAHCLAQRLRTAAARVACAQLHDKEIGVPKRVKILLVDHWVLEPQHAAVQLWVVERRGRLRQHVALTAQEDAQAHHEGLAVGVDGRVRDLGEALREVVVEHVWALTQDGKWLVIAHAEGRLPSGDGHALDNHVDVLGRVAHRQLPAQQVLLRIGHLALAHGLLVLELLAEVLHPCLVRLLLRHAALDVHIFHQLASAEVDGHHLARAQATLHGELLRLDVVQNADLAGDDGGAVLEGEVPRRA